MPRIVITVAACFSSPTAHRRELSRAADIGDIGPWQPSEGGTRPRAWGCPPPLDPPPWQNQYSILFTIRQKSWPNHFMLVMISCGAPGGGCRGSLRRGAAEGWGGRRQHRPASSARNRQQQKRVDSSKQQQAGAATSGTKQQPAAAISSHHVQEGAPREARAA